MLVTNDMTSDSRVARHSRALGMAGYKTTVICELSGTTLPAEKREGYSIVRVHSKVAEYANLLDQRLAQSEPKQQGQEQPRFLARRKNPSWVLRLILTMLKISFKQIALLREAKRSRADIYCANDLDMLLLAILAGHDRKVLYDSHELWPDMLVGVPSFMKQMLQSYEKALIKMVNSVMTVNEFIAQELTRRYSLTSPVHVVYNCVSSQSSATEKTQKPRTGSLKIALYHGWYSPERGLENLIRSSSVLYSDILLILRGAGKLERELRRLATGKSNIRFERPVAQKDVVDAASEADVGIIPYLPTNLCNYYASPNKLFEYMEAGLPIAASNLPFMRKLITDNQIGTLFDARDPRSIARALNEITRPSQLNRYRRNLIVARRKYTWDLESKKLLEIYANLTTRRAG